MLVLKYPLERIDLRDWARSTLAVDRLEDLHLHPDPIPFENYAVRLRYYTDLLKNNFDLVRDQYLQLVHFIEPFFKGFTRRQIPPTFRCHLAGAGTASAFHRDGEPKYKLLPGMINGWVPLTTVSGNNSICVESEFGSEDYRPISLQPGEILIFDAFHLKHGSFRNDTQTTRVSFDFRFLPAVPARVRELGILAKPGQGPDPTRT